MNLVYIEPEQALAVVEKLGFAIRDEGLLFSALARPSSGLFGADAYPSIELKAAALMSSLAQNHTLVDGNKRLAVILTFTFLLLNGIRVGLPQDAVFDLAQGAAQGTLSLEEIADVLRRGMRVSR